MHRVDRIFTAILCLIVTAMPLAARAQTWQIQQKTIPIAVENAACNPATDTFGLTSGQAVLLTCQSGKWVKQGGSSVIAPLYLRNAGALPAACPAAWSQVDVGFISESGGAGNYVRSCLPPKGKTCSVMYFKNAGAAPASCPSPWVQGDLGFVFESSTAGNYVRSCLRCE